MTRVFNHTAALLAAVFVTVVSLNAVVTVPPVEVATYAAPILA